MLIVRFLVLLFNVVVITLLVYRMFQLNNETIPAFKKRVIWIAGILLLIVPVAIIFRIIPFSMVYLMIYPVAVAFFLYLIKQN